MNDNKLAACVILYNPDGTIRSNIESYVGICSKTYIIDNSDECNDELKDYYKNNPKVQYFPQFQNIGIAKALNMAFEKAKDDGFEWLLTMDQDSYITCSDFFEIEDVIQQDKSVAIIAARYSDSIYKPRDYDITRFYETGAVITSGNLVNTFAWNAVGGFTEKLFIDEVDNEFCIKLKQKGYKLLITRKMCLQHNLGELFYAKNIFSNKQVVLTLHSPLRMYYMTRNNLYLWKKFIFSDYPIVFNRIKNLLKHVYNITLFYPKKLVYYRYMYMGLVHFLKGKYGKL